MLKKVFIFISALGFFTLSLTPRGFADDTPPRLNAPDPQLYQQVVSLDLHRKGYTLGAPLTPAQQKVAFSHLAVDAAPGTYKFMDGDLAVVADAHSHRVILIFEKFKDVPAQTVHNLVGSLFMDYGEPTTAAHDKIIYWAYGNKKKISSQRFQEAKDKKQALKILATVKLNSSLRVQGDDATDKNGDVYYIISSPPVLKYFKENPEN